MAAPPAHGNGCAQHGNRRQNRYMLGQRAIDTDRPT
jgi:hypothetical protein